MKNKLIAISLTSLASLNSYAAEPAKQSYAGANLSFLSYEEIGLDADLTAISGRLGAYINDYVSVEGRLGFGIQGDDVTLLDTKVDIELNYIFGVYTRAGLPVTDQLYPYLMLGFSRAEVEASGGGITVEEAESDVSFGLGADFRISQTLSLNVEYANLFDKNGAEVSGFSLGVSSAF